MAHLQRDQRADPAADVHGLVEDAPGHRAVAAVGGLDERALDARLEDRRAGGQQHRAGEEAPVTVKPRHDQVAQALDDRRGEDRLLVAVAVGQAAGEDRDERLHQIPAQQQRAERGHRHAQPALGSGPRRVERRHRAHAVIGQALDHLHAADDPEDVAEARDGRPEAELLHVGERGLVGRRVPGAGWLVGSYQSRVLSRPYSPDAQGGQRIARD